MHNKTKFAISCIAISLLFEASVAIIFDEVSSLHIWITVSSLVNNDPNNHKAIIFRQIELNWINAPLEDENDYIGLYLDNEPKENVLPVSVHRLNGQINGQIITDFYLPQISMLNHSSRSLPASTIYDLDDGSERDQFGYVTLEEKRTLPDECVGYCLAYFARNQMIAKNCLKTNPNWMRDSYQYINGRSLTTLMIPGTHNSGTYSSKRELDKNVLLNLFNKYELNQDESIFNQLVYGIRHLDLRVGYKQLKNSNERLWIYHDIFRTEITVREVLEQVKRFLEMTSHEIIIMDFHRFTVGFQNENQAVQREHHAKLIQMIYHYLGQYIIPSYLGLNAPISEYIGQGKRLVVGYANKASIVGPESAQMGLLESRRANLVVRDIDAAKQDGDDLLAPAASNRSKLEEQGSFLRKFKPLKLLGNSIMKPKRNGSMSQKLVDYEDSNFNVGQLISKANLFFPSIRHLWPNKDTIEGLKQYMNDTTCRKYFGELSSMMIQLTPTVLGAISDKYDGNRQLAEQVNRLASDLIRARWLHCINIVASDYFLGNDLIRLSVYANKMRVRRDISLDLNNYGGQCRHFRRLEHLLDKSKIPIQFAHQASIESRDGQTDGRSSRARELFIRHKTSDGHEIYLRPLTPSFNPQSVGSRQSRGSGQRESFVDSVTDGFSNLFSSFKRLLSI